MILNVYFTYLTFCEDKVHQGNVKESKKERFQIDLHTWVHIWVSHIPMYSLVHVLMSGSPCPECSGLLCLPVGVLYSKLKEWSVCLELEENELWRSDSVYEVSFFFSPPLSIGVMNSRHVDLKLKKLTEVRPQGGSSPSSSSSSSSLTASSTSLLSPGDEAHLSLQVCVCVRLLFCSLACFTAISVAFL